jgi:uncharacterized membrane protein
VNPFDPRTVALAKHAQHVVLIHFPIALFIAAVAFDYGAQWTKSEALAAADTSTCCSPRSRRSRSLRLGSSRGNGPLEGQHLAGILLMHLVVGHRLERADVVRLLDALARPSDSAAASLPTYRLPLEAIGVLLVALTGHLGGFLTGVKRRLECSCNVLPDRAAARTGSRSGARRGTGPAGSGRETHGCLNAGGFMCATQAASGCAGSSKKCAATRSKQSPSVHAPQVERAVPETGMLMNVQPAVAEQNSRAPVGRGHAVHRTAQHEDR